MKYLQYILLSVLGIFFFTSCEDVIVLDLDNSEPRVVVEAVVDMNTQSIAIDLTLTNDFYDNADPVKITDAIINLSNESGEQTEIPVNADGSYSLSPINIVEGENYTLEVNANGETFTAISQAPFSVDLIGIDTILNEPFFGSGSPFYQSLFRWQDQEGTENYYRLKAFINDTLSGPLAFYNDNGLDGQLFLRPLMAAVFPGDSVEFQLISIDKNTHDYFLQVATVQEQGFGGTTPFNPRGNFDNDALGYFGIKTTNSISIQF